MLGTNILYVTSSPHQEMFSTRLHTTKMAGTFAHLLLYNLFLTSAHAFVPLKGFESSCRSSFLRPALHGAFNSPPTASPSPPCFSADSVAPELSGVFARHCVQDVPLPYRRLQCPLMMAKYSCEHQETKWHPKFAGRLRFKPSGCALADFDAARLLKRLSGRRLFFFGDSLTRQHFISLGCLLWPHAVRNAEKHILWATPAAPVRCTHQKCIRHGPHSRFRSFENHDRACVDFRSDGGTNDADSSSDSTTTISGDGDSQVRICFAGSFTDAVRGLERTAVHGFDDEGSEAVDEDEDKYMLRSAFRASDVLVLNNGALQLNRTSFLDLMARMSNAVGAIRSYNDDSDGKLHASSSLTLIYRDRSPQHFQITPTGSQAYQEPCIEQWPNDKGEGGPAVASAERDALRALLAGSTTGINSRVRVGVLRTHQLLTENPTGFLHVGFLGPDIGDGEEEDKKKKKEEVDRQFSNRAVATKDTGERSNTKSARSHSPRFDCTHWCAPGVPDLWSQLLDNAIGALLQ